MPVGLQAFQSANDINAMGGGLARDLNHIMVRIQEFQLFLLATDLKAAPYNMTEADEGVIKSAFTDLNQLREVYEGLDDRTPAYDYRVFAKQLFGFGFA